MFTRSLLLLLLPLAIACENDRTVGQLPDRGPSRPADASGAPDASALDASPAAPDAAPSDADGGSPAPDAAPNCMDLCAAEGVTRCGSGSIQTCTRMPEGCLDWTGATRCPDGVCADTTSCRSCVHGCPSAGLTDCVNGQLRSCAADANGCRAWSAPTPCADGFCADRASCGACNNDCPSAGAVRCAAGNTETCVADAQGCLSWSNPRACPERFCADATSCGACTHTCLSAGATECAGGQLRTCSADANGCRSWSAPAPCADGFCADATACGACNHACPGAGATACSAGALSTCTADANGCRAWSAPMSCASNTCLDATQCTTCTPTCTTSGALSCTAGVLSQCAPDPLGCLTQTNQTCALGCAGTSSCNSCDPMDLALVGRVATQSNIINAYARMIRVGAHLLVVEDGLIEVFSLANPVAPVRVTTAMSCARPGDATLSGTTLFVACTDQVRRFDVTNPAAPSALPALTAMGNHESLAVANNLLYAAGSAGLRVFDLGGAATTPIGSLPISGLFAVTAAGPWAYVSTAFALQVIDVSNPASPTLAGGYTSANAILFEHLSIVGNRIYATSQNPQANAPGVTIFDISAVPALTIVGTALPNAQLGRHALDGNTLYVSRFGVGALDLSGGPSPRLIAQHNGAGYADILSDGPYIYSSGGGEIVVLAKASLSRQIGALSVTGQVNAMAAHGNLVYAAGTRLWTIDASAPAAPTVIDDQAIAGGRVEVVGDRLYVLRHDRLSILSITNPRRPTLLGQLTLFLANDLVVVGNLAIISSSNTSTFDDEVGFYDVTNPAMIRRAGAYTMDDAGALAYRSGYLYAAGSSFNSSRIDIVFVAPFTSGATVAPLYVGRVNRGADALEIFGNTLVAAGTNLGVYDLTQPVAPALLWERARAFHERVHYDGRYLHGVDVNGEDVAVYDLANRAAPVRVVYETWLDDHTDVVSVGPYTYLSGPSGLRVIDRCAP